MLKNTFIKSILGISFALLLSNCESKEKMVTTIKVNAIYVEDASLSVYSILSDFYDELNIEKDSTILPFETSTILTIIDNRRGFGYAYIKPEEQIILDTIASSPILYGAVGSISEENLFLNKYVKQNAELNKGKIFELGAKEADSFRMALKELYNPLQSLLDELKEDKRLSADFKALMKNRILNDIASPYLNYSNYYFYNNGKDPEVTDDFYEPIQAINFSDKKQLAFRETLDIGKTWATNQIRYLDFESLQAYNKAIISKMQATFGDSELHDYYTYSKIAKDVNFGNGIDANSIAIEEFFNTVNNSALKNLITNTVSPWANLKSGLDAPEFIGQTRDGEKISSKSLKGKKIYIDVWATWCAPCIAEIPALKELEHDLKNENIEFVSVSIDQQKDLEKWKEFIKKKDLGGLQLHAQGEFNSSITKKYNISGIPRFILIDENGKILNSNAPRPSDPSTKEILKQT